MMSFLIRRDRWVIAGMYNIELCPSIEIKCIINPSRIYIYYEMITSEFRCLLCYLLVNNIGNIKYCIILLL